MTDAEKIINMETHKPLCGKQMNIKRCVYACYIEKQPLVSVSGNLFILKDKDTKKEIVSWKSDKYLGGKSMRVIRTMQDIQKYDEFLARAANDKTIGQELQNKNGVFAVLVTGVPLNVNDGKIHIMDAIYRVCQQR